MGATAKLHRHAGHIDNTHHIGIFFAEHCHRTSGLGCLDRHLLHFKRMSIGDPAIDQVLDPFQLFGCDRTRAMKIETQTIEIHQRASLADARVHHLL